MKGMPFLRASGRAPRAAVLLLLALSGQALYSQAAPKVAKSAAPWRLPGGVAGQAYSQSLALDQPNWKRWSQVSPEVPGLQLKPSGELAGTPTTEGIFRLSITAADGRGHATHATVFLAISSRVGPPSPEDLLQSGAPVLVNTCRTLEADKSYQLQHDLGADERAACLRLSGPNIRLDLAGHTVRGRITGKAIDINGIVIANGKVSCNFGDTETGHGCIELTSEAPSNKTVLLRNLEVRQLSTIADNAARAVHIDWTAESNSLSPTTPAVRLSGITASVSASKGHRSPVLGVQGYGITVEVDHNQITCPEGSNACQGIVCYGVHGCWVHANRILLASNPKIEETARAILFDQLNRKASDFGEAWNNVIVANEGRAIRIRGAFNVWVHDNRIESVEDAGDTGSYVGAVHLGDPDAGVDDLKDTRIFRNTVELGRRGLVIFARNARGAVVENNTILCKAPCTDADFASVRSPLEPGDGSKLTLRNNLGVGISLESNVERGADLDICNSGSATGKGRINRPSDCNSRK